MCVCVCVCVRLTHSLEGGVFVESHSAVVAVRVWKPLSRLPISGVIQLVLLWWETTSGTVNMYKYSPLETVGFPVKQKPS